MRASSRSGTPAVPARASTTSTPMATSLARRQARGPGLPDDGRRGDRGQVPHRREAGRRHPGVVVERIRGATGQADGGVDQRQHPHPAAAASSPTPRRRHRRCTTRITTTARGTRTAPTWARAARTAHGLGQPAGGATEIAREPLARVRGDADEEGEDEGDERPEDEADHVARVAEVPLARRLVRAGLGAIDAARPGTSSSVTGAPSGREACSDDRWSGEHQ